MRDFADDLAALRKRLEEAKTYLDLTGLQARLSALEADVGRPDLWDDPDAARKYKAGLIEWAKTIQAKGATGLAISGDCTLTVRPSPS